MKDTTTREWSESPPPGRPAPDDERFSDIKRRWADHGFDDIDHEDVEFLVTNRDALAARLADAEAALVEYGRHDSDCWYDMHYCKAECVCGFDEALAAAREPGGGEGG